MRLLALAINMAVKNSESALAPGIVKLPKSDIFRSLLLNVKRKCRP